MKIDIWNDTLVDVVAANQAAASVLEAFGLDYCCHGRRSLTEACHRAGLDPNVVVEKLAGLERPEVPMWSKLPPAQLADHIVAIHHRYLEEELPLLDALAEKVLSVHGAMHPELDEVSRLVSEIRADLVPHMAKEERVLFPAIHALAAGQTSFPFGSIANPVRMMMQEHDRAGELLAELREVTHGYEAPDDACSSYRALFARLDVLEHDTHTHIHKENNVLFPAALELAC
jgi:regulator of cell morphogenesis and NO signaling